MSKHVNIFLNTLWLTGILVSMFFIGKYSFTNGPAQNFERAPANTELIKFDGPQLLVFLHPKCACSEATLIELKNMLPDLKDLPVTLVFNNPAGQKAWLEGKIWNHAKELKSVAIFVDNDGVETKRFGALTSGHTMLIGENRDVIFSGGLTASRGHIGMSEGQAFLRSWKSSEPSKFVSKVFGCLLFKDLI